MAADRAPFIDQSQALTLYMVKANEENISDMHISTWKLVSVISAQLVNIVNDNLIFFLGVENRNVSVKD